MKIKDYFNTNCANNKNLKIEATKDIKVIGVTGTLGKSSVATLVYKYLAEKRKKVYAISTLGIWCTTNHDLDIEDFQQSCYKDKISLDRHIRNAILEDCDYLILEITAEAIFNGLYNSLDFDILALSMFRYGVTRSFDSEVAYLSTKANLFKNPNCKKIIINSNSKEFLEEVKKDRTEGLVTFGNETDNYFYTKFDTLNNGRITATFNDSPTEFKTNLISSINKDNLLCFYTIIKELGLYDEDFFKQLLPKLVIRGRMKSFEIDGREIIIDSGYGGADGLKPSLEELPVKNTITVLSTFNFSTNKNDPEIQSLREEKGILLDNYSSELILTSTHRGTDDELKNIEQMKTFCPNAITEPNRVYAIKKAWADSKPGDRIFLIGKGTERDIKFGLFKLDDEDILRGIVEASKLFK